MPLIVHISDLHVSELGFDEDVFIKAVAEINAINPDMIILTGDLTNNGYYNEFVQATKYLGMFDAPLFAVPGNHDARNLGYETFEELIGECSWKLTKDDEFVVVGLDSSSPDISSGNIGRPQHLWMEHQLDQCVIDVTDVKEIKTGDVVYIIDCDDINLSSEKFAMNADTITNEFLSRLGNRLPRIRS